MKFVVVTIRRNPNPEAPPMMRPTGFNAKEIHNSSGGPQLLDGGIGRGEPTEEELICVQDNLADRLNLSEDMKIINKVEADAWIEAYANRRGIPEEQVTDSNRIVAIQAKGLAQIPLSAEDLEALDPDKGVQGINRKTKNVAGYYPNA